MLTEAQISEYNEKGYLVIPNFTSTGEVAELQKCGKELIQQMDPRSVSIFSTRNQTAKTDQYFLDSANGVSFFFEEGAFDHDGNLVKDKTLAINKIGHGRSHRHDLRLQFSICSGSPLPILTPSETFFLLSHS